MFTSHPGRRLTRLADVAPSIATPEGAQIWGAHVSAEIDRITAKLRSLALAAQAKPNDRNINRARAFCAQVEPAIERAAEAQNRLNAMFFAEPPSFTPN